MKKMISILLSLCLISLLPAAALAESKKEEVIYASLSASGEASALYAVNVFSLTQEQETTDFGTYSEVKNLTDLAALSLKEDAVTFTTTSPRFYYQGNMAGAELPWLFTVAYTLDGAEISPDQLAGRSGAVALTIDVKKNELQTGAYYENLMVQASLNLDAAKATNIVAEGATIVNAGGSKTISATALPGKGLHLVVSFDAEDFSFDGITFAAIPFSMSFDMPDMSAFTSQLSELTAATSSLAAGVSGVLTGVTSLEEGAQALAGALSAAGTQDSSALTGQLAVLSESLPALAASLPPETAAALNGLVSALTAAATTMQTAADGMAQAASGAQSLADGLTSLKTNLEPLKTGADSLSTAAGTIPAQMTEAISGITAQYDYSDYSPVSFTDSRNGEVALVQFIMTTDAIKLPALIQAEAEEEENTLLTRLENLFR